MAKFDVLMEDESDIFGGSPVSRYWDIHGQLSTDLVRDEFDKIVERLAAMEQLLAQSHDYEDLDKTVESFCVTNFDKIDDWKKSTYMELTGKLIYRLND
ncbi:MAG: DUF2018 family protein [Campylobacterales bacterium]|nr:DUF2018 family protein [Campylobacterales bacterium]